MQLYQVSTLWWQPSSLKIHLGWWVSYLNHAQITAKYAKPWLRVTQMILGRCMIIPECFFCGWISVLDTR